LAINREAGALGQIGTVPLIALPGNPVAAFVTFVTIAKPLILNWPAQRRRHRSYSRYLPVSATARRRDGARYLRASLERGGSGLVAMKYIHNGSAILSSTVRSDGLAVLDEDAGDLAARSVIDFMPLTEALA
jgi:molybdopterin molybdotransferase